MTPPETYVRESEIDDNEIYIHKKSGKSVRLVAELCNITHSPDLPYGEYLFRMYQTEPIDDNPMPEILPGMGVKAQGYEVYTVAKVINDKAMCHHAGRGLLEICKKEAITEILDNEGDLIWEARK